MSREDRLTRTCPLPLGQARFVNRFPYLVPIGFQVFGVDIPMSPACRFPFGPATESALFDYPYLKYFT